MKAQAGSGDPQQHRGDSQLTERIAESLQRAYARFVGLMYFLVLIFDTGCVLITSSIAGNGSFVETAHRIAASEPLYRLGLCCSLAGSLYAILLAIGHYATVRPVDTNLAMMALVFRVAEAVIGAVGISIAFSVLQIQLEASHINTFGANQLSTLADLNSHAASVGTDGSAIFFSLGSTIFFYLFLKSKYIPKILSAWGIFASLVYMAVWFVSLILPQYSGTAAVYGSAPILIAELSTGLWLMILGIKVNPGSSTIQNIETPSRSKR